MKKLNVTASSDLKGVADNITRLLLGNPKSALSQLNRLLPLEGLDFSTVGPTEYNELYSKVYKGIFDVLKKIKFYTE